MMSEEKNSSYRGHIINLIVQFSGQHNTITIPRPFIKICGDIPTAMLLSQLLYWSDKGIRPDGFIFKTYSQWKEELGLGESQVRRAVQRLKKEGVIETKLKKAINGAPTLHYRIKKDEFQEWILNKVQNGILNNERLDSVDTQDSSNNDYNKEYNIKKYKTSNLNKSDAHPPFSLFNKIKNEIPIEDHCVEAQDRVREYFGRYENNCSKPHPRMKDEQIELVPSSMESFIDTSEIYEHREYSDILDSYFNRTDIDTDYNINHFASWVHGLVEVMGQI